MNISCSTTTAADAQRQVFVFQVGPDRHRAVDQVAAVEQIEALADGDGVDRDRARQRIGGILPLHPEERPQRVGQQRQADEDHPPHAKTGEQGAVYRTRHALHHIRLVRLEGAHQAQCHRGDHIDPQDLRCRDRHREADEDRDHDHQALRHVGRQEEQDRLFDVVVHRAPFLDGGADRREVVVGQHHFGGLLGDLGALDAHRHADVGFLQCRGVVDAVAGHGDDLAVGLDRLHQSQLVLGAGPGEHINRLDALAQFGRVELLDLHALHRGLAVADTEHFRDGRRGDLVVAGDHRHADAAVVAFLDRRDRFLARRIEQADQAQQHEIARQVGRREAADVQSGRVLDPGNTQHPLALSGQCVRLPRRSTRGRSVRSRRCATAGGCNARGSPPARP